ncbi:MAG: glycosyltransferase family 9 protein [Sulfuricurvum sp.]|nr:glycosyltransferase family 9 protein [Sulfuricurvum sp.]
MTKVYTANSVNDVFSIVKKQEKWSIQLFVRYIFIKSEIIFFNLILNCIQLFLFEKKLPKEQEIKTIVVYSIGILGDNVVRLPAILALKKRYPLAKLIVINKYQNWNPIVPKQLFENAPYIDDLILTKNNPVQRQGLRFVYDNSLTKDLICDLFVNLSPLGARGWFGAVVRELLLAKKLKSRFVAGFQMYSLLNLKKVNPIRHRIADINYPRLPEKILKKIHINIDYNLEVFPHNDTTTKNIVSKLKEAPILTGYAILHPGSALPCQRWPASRYAEIGRYLKSQYGLTAIITGVENERELANDVIAASDGSAISFAGKTSLGETIELIKNAKIVISNDTGLLHLASIQNVPTLGIFGTRENPKWWFPLGTKKYVILGFSNDSLRYNDENIITDLLNIEVDEVKKLIDQMFIEFQIG